MIWLKACPRCRGDLTLQSDMYGSYLACIQCGGEFEEAEFRKVSASAPYVSTARSVPGPAGRRLGAQTPAMAATRGR
jgi:hypothetical protein